MVFSLKDISRDAIEKIRSIPTDKEYVALIRDREYLEIDNFSNTADKIKIDTSVLQPGDIIFHTHFSDDQDGWLSEIDIKSAFLVGYPCLLYHTKFRVWDYFDPTFPHPRPLDVMTPSLIADNFVKLKYESVRCDCYSFARNYREAIYGLKMKDIYTENCDPAYWYPKFADVEALGFLKIDKPITEVSAGDILLVNVSVKMPYHLIVATSNVRGIHQLTKHSEYCYLPEFESNLRGIYTYVGN